MAVVMAAQTRALVDRACPRAELRTQLALLYAGHNLGHAALAEALTHGCSEAAVRAGAIAHYRGKGARIAKAYAQKFKPECLAAGGDDAACTAGPKLDYAFHFADAVLAAGVTQWAVEPDAGACPIR